MHSFPRVIIYTNYWAMMSSLQSIGENALILNRSCRVENILP
jgi:hypothetical protein